MLTPISSYRIFSFLPSFFFLLLGYDCYPQNLTIDETVTYINNHLKANPIGTFVSSIYITSDQQLVITSEYAIEKAFIEDLNPQGVTVKTLNGKTQVSISCKNDKDCVSRDKFYDSPQGRRSFWLEFGHNTRIVDQVKNAFEYLIREAQVNALSSINEQRQGDPFAKPVVYDELKNLSHPSENLVRMTKLMDGTYSVPVVLNGVLSIGFILDSGASEVFIAPDVAFTLIRTGTVIESDFIGSQTYQFADGSTAQSERFIIKKLQIGNQVLTNVSAAISNSLQAPMLLGQNVLSRLGKITIDYNSHLLMISK